MDGYKKYSFLTFYLVSNSFSHPSSQDHYITKTVGDIRFYALLEAF